MIRPLNAQLVVGRRCVAFPSGLRGLRGLIRRRAGWGARGGGNQGCWLGRAASELEVRRQSQQSMQVRRYNNTRPASIQALASCTLARIPTKVAVECVKERLARAQQQQQQCCGVPPREVSRLLRARMRRRTQ